MSSDTLQPVPQVSSIGLLGRLLVDIPIVWSVDIMHNHSIHLPNSHPLTFRFFPCDLRQSGRMCGRDRSGLLRSLFYQEVLWQVCLHHLSDFPLGSGRTTLAPQYFGALWESWMLSIATLSPRILAHANSWCMTSFVIIIMLFGCLGNVHSKYHFNRVVSLLTGIVSVFYVHRLNLDRWWENNFSYLNLVHKINRWGNSFQFKFQTHVQVFNFRKFPKVTFFLHNFQKLF